MNSIDVARPVDFDERLHALDVLRGLALFGMILVHFHQKTRAEATGLEDLIGWGVWILVEQKAWGTFAFLFGAGFAILLRRLERRGAPIVAIYVRRLATLAVFGIVAEVGFGFHILFGYACWGLALLVMRQWSSRALLVAAAVSASARPIAAEIVAIHAWWTSAAPPPPLTLASLSRAVDAAARQESYLALLSARWSLFTAAFHVSWRDILPDVNLALFILGLLAVRHGIFDAPKRHVRVIAAWMMFGAAAWACSWLVLPHLPAIPIPGAMSPIEYGLGLVQDQWLCFTYIGAIVLLLAFRPAWTARLAIFGLAGRMALTNYLMQAAVLDALSSGYGANLKLRPFVYPLAAVVLFGAQVIISRVWLARYRFGPLEWLWRAATYARVPPLRRVHVEVQPT
ncbi:MAG TPA: DUF418 domain-containing protein [Vicinamibacterales bacterium]|nr:DUF418 domain-containing protein [Vicinamibacterales bacterium]